MRNESDEEIKLIVNEFIEKWSEQNPTLDKDFYWSGVNDGVYLLLKHQESKPKATETFLDRLIKERDELETKFKGLSTSLAKGVEFADKVGATQHILLVRQSHVMADYLAILNERINDLLGVKSGSGS